MFHTRSTVLNMCSNIYLLFAVLLIAANSAQTNRTRRQNRSHQLLASIGIHAKPYNVLKPVTNALPDYTNIDRDFRQLFINTRSTSLNWALQDMEALYNRNRREGKLQIPIPNQVPFPCPLNNTRSRTTPTSVEHLRPGDIDVIAAIGDSLSAGNGIMSNSALDMINEFRGLVFSGGGMGNWRNTLTLPNILKEFNPQLYGYATAHSLVVNHQKSHLSIAEPMIMSHDLLYQARLLIDLLQRDPNVDMQRNWKLLTVYVGNNDICSDMCHWNNPQAFLDRHERDLRQAFRLLRDNVPRLLINLIVVPNISLTMSGLKRVPLSCYLVHRIACHCLLSDRLSQEQIEQRTNIIRKWQQLDLDIARLPEFQRKDFAIVGHPLIANLSTPVLPNGETDWRIFSHDCFHFSQRMHAIVSNMLWNSMLLPDEQKPRPNVLPKPFERFLCPSKEQPYLVVRPS